MGQAVKDNQATYGEREGFTVPIGALRKRKLCWYCIYCGKVSKTRKFAGPCRGKLTHSGSRI